MDYLRSGYRTYIRLHPDSDPVPIKWYRAPKGARVFPGPHRHGSLNWEDDKENSGLGEQSVAPRPYFNGKAPARYRGDRPCGPRYLLTGEKGPKPVTPLNLANGNPTCCPTVPDPVLLPSKAVITKYRGNVPLSCSACGSVPAILVCSVTYVDGPGGRFTGARFNLVWNGTLLYGRLEWDAEWYLEATLSCLGPGGTIVLVLAAIWRENPVFNSYTTVFATSSVTETCGSSYHFTGISSPGSGDEATRSIRVDLDPLHEE